MLRTIERAYEAHRSVPRSLYYSPEAIIWTLRRPLLHLSATETLRQIDRCRSELNAHLTIDGFSTAGAITRALLLENFLSDSAIGFVPDDLALKNALAAGRLPQFIPFSSSPISSEDAIQTARDLGYLVPAVPTKNASDRRDEENAFAAAHYLALRRFSPDVMFLTSRFIIPDPVARPRTACFLDELFIVRGANEKDHVRLLGLQIDGIIDDRRDALLAGMGYEIFHVVGPWTRIDPLRVIVELFTLAGLPVSDRFVSPVRGPSIADYRCSYCHGPMIRTASGEGIAVCRDSPVHEECFNAAVDSGVQ